MKMRFPGFKILDRYILGKFLSTYFFAIAMIIVIVVVFDYVEKIDDFTELHAPLKSVILDYYLNFIPYFINQFSGLFTFIACIFFTARSSRASSPTSAATTTAPARPRSSCWNATKAAR